MSEIDELEDINIDEPSSIASFVDTSQVQGVELGYTHASYQPQSGDIVWAQSQDAMPYWPGCVFDQDCVPEQSRELISFPAGATSRVIVYMFASDHFDVAMCDKVVPYLMNRETYVVQEVNTQYRGLFQESISIADTEAMKSSHDRVSWIVCPIRMHSPSFQQGDHSNLFLSEAPEGDDGCVLIERDQSDTSNVSPESYVDVGHSTIVSSESENAQSSVEVVDASSYFGQEAIDPLDDIVLSDSDADADHCDTSTSEDTSAVLKALDEGVDKINVVNDAAEFSASRLVGEVVAVTEDDTTASQSIEVAAQSSELETSSNAFCAPLESPFASDTNDSCSLLNGQTLVGDTAPLPHVDQFPQQQTLCGFDVSSVVEEAESDTAGLISNVKDDATNAGEIFSYAKLDQIQDSSELSNAVRKDLSPRIQSPKLETEANAGALANVEASPTILTANTEAKFEFLPQDSSPFTNSNPSPVLDASALFGAAPSLQNLPTSRPTSRGPIKPAADAADLFGPASDNNPRESAKSFAPPRNPAQPAAAADLFGPSPPSNNLFSAPVQSQSRSPVPTAAAAGLFGFSDEKSASSDLFSSSPPKPDILNGSSVPPRAPPRAPPVHHRRSPAPTIGAAADLFGGGSYAITHADPFAVPAGAASSSAAADLFGATSGMQSPGKVDDSKVVLHTSPCIEPSASPATPAPPLPNQPYSVSDPIPVLPTATNCFSSDSFPSSPAAVFEDPPSAPIPVHSVVSALVSPSKTASDYEFIDIDSQPATPALFPKPQCSSVTPPAVLSSSGITNDESSGPKQQTSVATALPAAAFVPPVTTNVPSIPSILVRPGSVPFPNLAQRALAAGSTSNTAPQSTVQAPRFQGKATLVAGASPFDTPSSGPTAVPDSLFGAPPVVNQRPKANDPFGSSAPIGNGAAAASLFGESPAQPFSSGPTNATPAAPASQAADIFASVTHANVARPRTVTKGGRQDVPATAQDLFALPGPGPQANKPTAAPIASNPGAPPSAPGVKFVPPVPARVSPVVPTASTIAAPVPAAVTPTTSHKVIKDPTPTVAPKAPPPGMIRTPHGFVPAPKVVAPVVSGPTTAIGASTAVGASPHSPAPIAPRLDGPPPPVTTPAVTAGASPTVQPAKAAAGILASAPAVSGLGTGVTQPHASIPLQADPTASLRPVAPTNNNTSYLGYHCVGRPTCGIMSFGFGGRIAYMLPVTRQPLNPLLPTADERARPYICGQIVVRRIFDMMSENCADLSIQEPDSSSSIRYPSVSSTHSNYSDSEKKMEFRQLCDLLTSFSGPIVGSTSSMSQVAIKQFISARVEGPTTVALPEQFFVSRSRSKALSDPLSKQAQPNASKSPAITAEIVSGTDSNIDNSGAMIDKGTVEQSSETSESSKHIEFSNVSNTRQSGRLTAISSERLLWNLLQILVDTNGAVSSQSGKHDSPEQRIVRLLLGLQQQYYPMPAIGDESESLSAAPQRDIKSTVTLPADATLIYSEKRSDHGSATPVRLSERELYPMIEALLLSGNRDDAAQLAADNLQWGLAFMLASVCSPAKYQAITRAYADMHFPSAAPLHLLSMVYSNQAANMLQHGGKSLLKPLSTIPLPGSKTLAPTPEPTAVSSAHIWRRNLAALISNKSGDWQTVLRLFGNKLEHEEGDVCAAHFAYLCGSALPVAFPGNATTTSTVPGHYSLLGCDVDRPFHRNICDTWALSAFRMTEIFEWAISTGLQAVTASKSSAGSSNTSAVGSAVSGLFGLLSFGGSVASSSAKEPVAATPGGVDPDWILISQQEFILMQAMLCPIKLQFAQTLADFGLVDEALAYGSEIRRLMKSLEQKAPSMAASTKPPTGPPTAGKEVDNNAPRLFKKSHAIALDLFMDRLDGGMGRKQAENGQGSQQDIAGGAATGGWGIGNMFSALANGNLKELVDDIAPGNSPPVPSVKTQPDRRPPLTVADTMQPVTGGSTIPPSGGPPSASAPVTISSATAAAPINRPRSQIKHPSQHPAQIALQQQQAAQAQSNNAIGTQESANQPASTPALPPMAPALPPMAPAPAITVSAGGIPRPGRMHVPPSGQRPSDAVTPNIPLTYSPAPGNYPMGQGGSWNDSGMGMGGGYSDFASSSPNPTTFTSMTQPNPQLQVSLAPPDASPTRTAVNSGSTSAAGRTGQPAPGASNGGVGALGGQPGGPSIVGSVKKGLMKWLYPDAHDANDNIGQGLEAYYDEATKKWVFPGEDSSNAAPDPASAPPPTGPIGSSFPPMGQPMAGAATADAPFDPLAALMAPPPRSMNFAATSAPTFSSMGAGGPPPSMPGSFPPPTFGMTPNQSTTNPQPSLSGPAMTAGPNAIDMPPPMTLQGGAVNANPFAAYAPPPSAMAAPPTNFNMWKPPPSATPTGDTSAFTGMAINLAQLSTANSMQPAPAELGQPNQNTETPQTQKIQDPNQDNPPQQPQVESTAHSFDNAYGAGSYSYQDQYQQSSFQSGGYDDVML